MANPDAAFGFRPYRHLSGGLIRASEYTVADGLAEDIFSGDPVISDGAGNIQPAAANELLLGVFFGVKWIATDGSVQFDKRWTTGTALKAGTTAKALVYDDPNITFIAQSSGTVVAADIGQIADLTVGTGDAQTGESRFEAGAFGGAETQLAMMRIIEVPRRDTASGNQVTTGAGLNAIVECKIARHQYAGAAAAVEV